MLVPHEEGKLYSFLLMCVLLSDCSLNVLKHTS